MNKKPNPELINSESPEWTEEIFVQAAHSLARVSAGFLEKFIEGATDSFAYIVEALRGEPCNLAQSLEQGRKLVLQHCHAYRVKRFYPSHQQLTK
jgi:hypothetical protein